MAIEPTQAERNLQASISIQSAQSLPKDMGEVIGKVRLKIIDIFSNIQAFFSTVVYGKTSTWRGFWKNVDSTFAKISSNKKIKLYQKLSKNKPYTSHVGYKTVSKEEAILLKKLNKDLKEYKAYKVKFTQKELHEIKPFLDKISNDSKDGSNILIDLNKFLTCKNIPLKIKNLIEKKLQQIPAYQILKKKLEEKIKQRQAQILKYNKLKKAAIIAVIFAATFGIGYTVYPYLKVASISLPTLFTPASIPIITPNVADAGSWWNSIEIFKETSPQEVRTMFLNIGKFFVQKPYQLTQKGFF